jgi:hypothetical protein
VAEVYRVNSETELETKILVAGIGNTYDVADDYKIWNIVQVTALGGNLVAVDDMGVPLASPVLPTAFTQIVLTASSSATIVETGVSGLTAGEAAQLTNIETITLSLQKLMKNRMETNPTTGVMTIYDDDDVTPLLTGNIYEDVLATQIYRGRGMERRNRLT